MRAFTTSAHGYPRVLQNFVKSVFHLKMPGHPNIVPFVGVSMSPFCILAERMPDSRNLAEYLEEHPEANRIGLVRPLLFIALADSDNVIPSQVAGCS